MQALLKIEAKPMQILKLPVTVKPRFTAPRFSANPDLLRVLGERKHPRGFTVPVTTYQLPLTSYHSCRFQNEIENTLLATDSLCDSDIISSHWTDDKEALARLDWYSKSLTTRGVVFSKDVSFVPKYDS